MKNCIVLVALLIPFLGATQNIDKNDLEKIRSEFVKDNYTTAMENALSSNPITDLAWSRENEGTSDHYFTYRVDVSGITNQKSSGRCWLFTSLNVFRPKAMRHFNVSAFEFSENYLYFYDLLEKANLFLNNIMATADRCFDDEKVRWYFRSPVDDGGQWINFVNLANKYGMVPREAMEETYSSENTAWMTKLLKRKLREQALELREMKNNGAGNEKINGRKVEMLGVIYRMLVLNLGEPPAQFEYRYKDKAGNLAAAKTYTPQSFMQEIMGDTPLSDYVMLMNDPSRPYHKHYEVENYRNVQEGENWHYVNLPNNEIKQFCIASIKNNEAMYASCDVGKQLRREFGVLDVDNFNYEAVYNVPFNLDKKQRIQTGDSGSTHGMALIAVEVDDQEKPVKWQFENSWGEKAGEKGYLTFTDEWFNEYMFRIVVNKKYINREVLDIYDSKPEMLPPWDPMF